MRGGAKMGQADIPIAVVRRAVEDVLGAWGGGQATAGMGTALSAVTSDGETSQSFPSLANLTVQPNGDRGSTK